MHVSGVFSNQVLRKAPYLDQILFVERKDGTYPVRVQAPIAKPQGAEELCFKFSSSGGRSASAEINNLAPEEVDRFL